MLDGIIVVNKPKGYTSHDVVSIVKKIVKEKVGHAGTLDPNTTGVLPLLIGKGTKLSYYLINHDKEYEVTLQLGEKTETADCEGSIIEKKEVSNDMLQKENIENVMKSFLGKQEQVPPIYSAIKVNGKKLYEYARQNEKVEIQPRKIEIYEINLKDILEEKKQIFFSVKCSKGTYIRSLCEDIAQKLGTVGYMKELQRTVAGEFTISQTVTIEQMQENINNKEFWENNFISIESFFNKLYPENEIELEEKRITPFLNGVKLTKILPDGLYRVYTKNKKFIGIGEVKNNLIKREIIVENNLSL